MKKLATFNYDITDYVTANKIDYLIEITKGKDELVKNAHIPTLEETEEMPDSQFALILYHPHIGKMKKLAMTDKYLTELNMRIFEDKVDSLPEDVVKVAAFHLCKAAKFYKLSIPDKLKKYASESVFTNWVNMAEVKETTSTKTASAETKFALEGKYPVHTPELVKKAVQYFGSHWRRFSPVSAFEYAVNVKIAADKLGVSYKGTQIEKYAYIDSKNLSKHFKAAVLARKNYAEEEVRSAYDELLTKSAELGLVKTAKVLEALDRQTGVSREWNKSIEDPIFTVFDVKIPVFVKHGNTEFALSDLQKLSAGVVDDATLADLKGPEGLEVFESLPLPVRNKIVKTIQSV